MLLWFYGTKSLESLIFGFRDLIRIVGYFGIQAWLRWLRTSAHGVTKDRQLFVYKCLNGIMSPSTQVALGRVSLTYTLNNPIHPENLSCSPVHVSV
jgi:drug/metabolite transporter superfamily protein YnfA